MADNQYDLVVIGAGPGGYVSAIRASQLGLKTAVIEKDKAGGVCGNWGCVPSKALLHQASIFNDISHLEHMGVKVDSSGLQYSRVQALSRKAALKSGKGVEYLLKKNKVDLVFGTGSISVPGEVTVSSKDGTTKIQAKNILVATGSRPREIPGFEFDEDLVLSSTGILGLVKLPKSLLILGAGAIGMEFAYVMNAFGVKVTIVEMMDRLLPLEDGDISTVIQDDFKKRGIEFITGVKAGDLKKTKSSVTISIEDKKGQKDSLKADKILVAVGRAPNSGETGLENLGIRSEKGFIKINDYYQTDIQGVYAIGDVIASPLLAHVASKEGEIAVEHMAGHSSHEKLVDPTHIPGAVYTEPGVGSFGHTEERAREEGLNYGVFSFPYAGIGKAAAIGKPNGLIKLVYDKETREILGGHVVGYCATELVHELLLARKAELLPEDVATMIHAHPTISEGLMEAARGIEGWAIHI